MRTGGRALVALLLVAWLALAARAEPPAPEEGGEGPHLWPEASAESTPPPTKKSVSRIVRLALKATYGDESTPFWRESLRLRIEGEFSETLLRLEPVLARYEDDDGALTRASLGVLMRQLLPGNLVIRGDVRFFYMGSNGSKDDVGLEYGAELQGRVAAAGLELRLGARRRSLLDAPPGWEPVAALQDQGYGGSTVASLRDRVMLSEGTAGLSWSPLRGSWSYLNVALGDIDGNLRRSIIAGAGLDLLAAARIETAWSATILYGLDDLAFSRSATRYWSPRHFRINHAGVDVRWARAARVYGVEAAALFGSEVTLGYFVGAFVRQPLGAALALEARFRLSDNGIFRVLNSAVGLVAEL